MISVCERLARWALDEEVPVRFRLGSIRFIFVKWRWSEYSELCPGINFISKNFLVCDGLIGVVILHIHIMFQYDT